MAASVALGAPAIAGSALALAMSAVPSTPQRTLRISGPGQSGVDETSSTRSTRVELAADSPTRRGGGAAMPRRRAFARGRARRPKGSVSMVAAAVVDAQVRRQ